MQHMRPCTQYSLRIEDQSHPQARLLRDGVATDWRVDGVLLEAQFELDDGSALLLLTEDSPYDELLHVYLLDGDGGGALVDALEAGSRSGLGGAGILELRRYGGDWLELGFLKGSPACRIELLAQPQIRVLAPQGWRYKKLLSKHRLRVVELEQGAA